MDRNGYNPSILSSSADCYLCGYGGDTARHEIFHGYNRGRSKYFGLWVYLCPACHNRVHNADGKADRFLKEAGQKVAMDHYHWATEDFRTWFGKNYI